MMLLIVVMEVVEVVDRDALCRIVPNAHLVLQFALHATRVVTT